MKLPDTAESKKRFYMKGLNKLIMMLLLPVLAAGVLYGCGAKDPAGSAGIAGSSAQNAEPVRNLATGTPWLASTIEGVVSEDTPNELKDDFYLHVNKESILNLKIPDGYSSAGTLRDIADKNENDMMALFTGEEPADHDERLAYDLYGLLMDWDTRNEMGIQPLKEKTDAVEQLKTLDELSAYFEQTPAEKVIGTSLWGFGMLPDIHNVDQYILFIKSKNFLLGDSAEYIELTDYGKLQKEAKSKLAEQMLVKLGYSKEEAGEKIDNCLKFEEQLAPAAASRREQQRPDFDDKSNNYYTREELAQTLGSVPFLGMIEQAYGFPQAETYRVFEPDYLKKLSELYQEQNLELIKDTLIVNKVVSDAWLYDRESYDLYMECDSTIEGTTGSVPDETFFTTKVSDLLPWPVAQMYSRTCLSEDDKARIRVLMEDTVAVYHDILSAADFFSEETRAKAIEKLDAITIHSLYPDSWEPYRMEELNFASKADGGNLSDAIAAMNGYEIMNSVRKYNAPVNRDEWAYPPQFVNAYYSPDTNSIAVLGAIAFGDIYNKDMTDEELYSRLGAIIGHEISHAFDSRGAQYDKYGNKSSWWTKEDEETFKKRNEKLADYFNHMHPWEGTDFQGDIMTGEACADMAGLKAMLLIAKTKENFDYDAFFRSHARLWLRKFVPNSAEAQIRDVHPMQYLRCNATLQQFDEFLDFYEIKEGDGMYLSKEDRVAIW